MKKLVSIFLVAFVGVSYFSCTKDQAPPPDCVITDTLNTYTKSVKEILDFNCAYGGCHDAVTASSGVILDTYESALSAASGNPKFFCVIDHTCTPYMPNTGGQLADSLIDKLNAWKANCYAP